MVAPVLTDYQYMFRDNGILIGGNWDAGLPGFIDVENITGLVLPEFELNSFEFDGSHGGISYAKYAKTRTIVLDGTLYTNGNSVDAVLDKLTTNYLPDNIDSPFYFKGAGIAQRYILCKSLGYKADITTLRRLGKSQVQFQLLADNPLKRIDNPLQTLVSGTSYNITNSGNVITQPIVTITGAYSQITIRNATYNKTLTLVGPAVAGDITVVDFRMKSVKLNNAQISARMSGPWWDLELGSNSIVVTATGSPAAMTLNTYSGWM